MKSPRRRFFLAVFSLFELSHAQSSQPPKSSGLSSHESCAIDPRAIVSDACASFSTLDSLNAELKPTISSLTKDSDFFSYYRLNLFNKECPFWAEDSNSMCGNIACAVNTIENEEDIPPIWRAEELGKLEGPKAAHPNRKIQQEAKPLRGELGGDVDESCVVEFDDECDERDYCIPEDESATAKGDYVSLIDNPERFTGYSGPGANHIWDAIYRENCFSRAPSGPSQSYLAKSPFGFPGSQNQAAQDLRSVMREHGRQQAEISGPQSNNLGEDLELDDECLEKRTFYRVISGMHASISTHICWDYLNKTTGTWGPNVQCFEERLHSHPERISNLYFNYALVLRAVAKARHSLESYTFCSGDPDQDYSTKQKVLELADKIALGPKIYDESLMFQDSSTNGALKDDFKNRFRNVSRAMDCVGCDKCRLWGKLQTAGYGTALKILFEFDEENNKDNPPLRRLELVALVNTLDKISHSLSAIGELEGMLEHGRDSSPSALSGKDEKSINDLSHENPIASTEKKNKREEEIFVPYTAPKSDGTIIGDFKRELSIVFQTAKWVIGIWTKTPAKFTQTLIRSLKFFWNFWLGVPQKESDNAYWEIMYRPSKKQEL